ncbi:hypothetical protein NC99_02000 [Sunxiuqinia dokdonensis]|uniref:Uncharacterized protein n=1 Tax=Sunxiuqinia dokdonensis TaxID=1409788 RepID=A0A0L8VET3_9BACT|nr:hypothetical protein NC99_02000 [Sunxiuqinia dokdonensis]
MVFDESNRSRELLSVVSFVLDLSNLWGDFVWNLLGSEEVKNKKVDPLAYLFSLN